MQAAIADAVNAVFDLGLALRDRLEAGERVQWDAEHAAFMQYFAAIDTNQNETEGGEIFFDEANASQRDRLARVTIRNVLAFWLDEWFSHYVPQGSGWDGLANVEGGTKFWDEARYAETRGDLDALEVMHLCVTLGYRGAWRDKPDQLDAWYTRIRQKLADATHPWAVPACLAAPTDAASPHDDSLLRRMAFSLLLTISLLAPLIAVLRWRF